MFLGINEIIRYRVFKKIFLLTMFMVVMVALIISTTLISLFSKSAIEDIAKKELIFLEQATYTADIINEQINTVSNQLLSNNNVINALYATETSVLEDLYLINLLKTKKGVNPFLVDIGLYNGKTGNYINIYNNNYSPVPIKNKAENYMEYYPVFYDTNTNYIDDRYGTLAFVLYPNYKLITNLDYNSSAIIIFISESYINNLLSNITNMNQIGKLFIFDNNGIVLSSSEKNKFMSNVSNEEYIKQILNNSREPGYFIIHNNENILVSYTISRVFDWYFVSVQDYSNIFSGVFKFRNDTMLFAFIVLIITLILSTIMLSKFYLPLRKIVDQYRNDISNKENSTFDESIIITKALDKLKTENMETITSLNRTYNMIKKDIILRIINAKNVPLKNNTPEEELVFNKIVNNFYRVIIISNDTKKKPNKMKINIDDKLTDFANVASEFIAKLAPNEAVTLYKNEIMILTHYRNPIKDIQFIEMLSILRETMLTEFKIPIICSIGIEVQSLIEINNSYNTAREYISYSLFYDGMSIFNKTFLKKHYESEVSYPFDAEKDIIEALAKEDIDHIQKKIKLFIVKIINAHYEQVFFYISRLLISIAMYYSNVLRFNEHLFNLISIYEKRVGKCESLDEVSETVLEYCSDILLLKKDEHSSIRDIKTLSIINIVKEMVQKSYKDPSFCIENVAQKIGISASYLARVYKSATGSSFSDSLRDVRLKEARDIILQTDDSIASICEQIGIFNQGNFSTLYKKRFGVSPSIDRELNGINKDAYG